jgi:hypothetical protein
VVHRTLQKSYTKNKYNIVILYKIVKHNTSNISPSSNQIMTSEKIYELQQKFQREINRISDSDRNTRKRGLQKLVESLPWTSPEDAEALRGLCLQTLFTPLLQGVADPVEKCREHSISLLTKTVGLCAPFETDQAIQLVNALCARVNDIPFPETGEEIRLQVLDLLSLVLSHPVAPGLLEACAPVVLQAMTKALQDSFPSVKRTCCDITILFCIHIPDAVRVHFKNLTKYLCVNALHQHHKVRSASLTVSTIHVIFRLRSELIYALCDKGIKRSLARGCRRPNF